MREKQNGMDDWLGPSDYRVQVRSHDTGKLWIYTQQIRVRKRRSRLKSRGRSTLGCRLVALSKKKRFRDHSDITDGPPLSPAKKVAGPEFFGAREAKHIEHFRFVVLKIGKNH